MNTSQTDVIIQSMTLLIELGIFEPAKVINALEKGDEELYRILSLKLAEILSYKSDNVKGDLKS